MKIVDDVYLIRTDSFDRVGLWLWYCLSTSLLFTLWFPSGQGLYTEVCWFYKHPLSGIMKRHV